MRITKEIGGRDYRFYKIDGIDCISVSTLANLFSPKFGLLKWKQSIGEEEAQRITNESATRGTKLHKLIEDRTPSADCPYIYSKFIENIEREIYPHLEVISQEKEVHYIIKNRGFAGRYDLLANWKNEITICDWKFTDKPKKFDYCISYFLQLAAYSLAIKYCNNIDVNKAAVFNITESGCNIIELTEAELSYYKEVIVELLHLSNSYLKCTDNSRYKLFNWSELVKDAKKLYKNNH